MDVFHEVLAKYWGYESFRPLQEDIIHSIYEGKDTLGLMPTGGGKSLTFQVPALCMEGICIVVTPLIALMKDQVDNLKKTGIKATAIYSGMSRQEIIKQLENCIFGDYKFLYVSPERLSTEIFLSKLQAMQVNILVVDESHCISQWGYDFRPSYFNIADIRTQLPDVPVLALTATATPEVVNDIQERLHFKKKQVFQKSFARTNLSYVVRETEDKINTLLHIIDKIPGTAIVYVRSRKRTKEISDALRLSGISADFFHAGLNRELKTQKQNAWKSGECRIIVSTNAFGMGIDKADVRLVVHIDMPSSLEEYYQEAGRGGRDEKQAYAVALCGKSDLRTLKKKLTDEFPERTFIERVYDALGNFYQIAVGFGMDTVHDFDLGLFCQNFKFAIIPTHHALKLLDLAGYITYTEEVESASRVMFTCTKDSLYQYKQEDKKTDELIQMLLRSYTGLFADPVFINESLLATRIQTTATDVFDRLSRLSKRRLLHYIPKKKTPLIIYTRTREELRYLTIPRIAYEERKERASNKLDKMVHYLTNHQACRSRVLLHYFGETKSQNCGSCDVCLAKNHLGLVHHQIVAINEALEKLLTTTWQDEKEIVNQLPFSTNKNITILRFLLDTETTYELLEGQLRKKK